MRTTRRSRRPSPRAVLRLAGLAVMAAAAHLPVAAAEAVPPDECTEHVLGSMWWCGHYRHTPLYKHPYPSSVQVATTGPHMEGYFTCRVDDGGASGSPVHPNRWVWHATIGGWLPDGKITSETDPVRPC